MPKEDRKIVRLVWSDDDDDLSTVFANHVVVSHASGNEFYLIFGEATPPASMLNAETPEMVSVRPVARVALSPGTMRRVAHALVENMRSYDEGRTILGSSGGEDAE